MNDNKKISLNTIVFIIASILVAYNIGKVYFVTITHDEALTYQMYISSSYGNIVSNPDITANNHILNSLLAKLCIDVFGDTLFAIRIPNILAHIIYLISTFGIVRLLFRKRILILTSFILLQANPFLFDFWGLSRGYGLAIGLMMCSMYYLFSYSKKYKPAYLLAALFFLTGSVYANLSILNYGMGLIAVLVLWLVIKANTPAAVKTVITTSIGGGCIYLLLVKPITYLKEGKELYYGGETGFISDTIGTLVQHIFYLEDNNQMILISSFMVVAIVLLCGIYWVVMFMRDRVKSKYGFALWLLVFIPALSTIIQTYVIDSKYLLDRTALFFYPLFILMLLYTIGAIFADEMHKVRYVVLPILLIFVVNFLAHASLKTTRIWYYDQHTPWLIQRMIEHKKNDGTIKIYLEWMYTPSLRYYVYRDYKDKFGYLENMNEVAYNKEDYDFCLIRDWERHKVPDIYILDTAFCDSQFYLYQRKQWDNNGTYDILIPENPIFTK